MFTIWHEIKTICAFEKELICIGFTSWGLVYLNYSHATCLTQTWTGLSLNCKPQKISVKFWLKADVKCKYCLNCFPQLKTTKNKVATLGIAPHLDDVCMRKQWSVISDQVFHLGETGWKAVT